MTTLVLGVAGAAAGFAFGGPIGASIGWSAATFAANYLVPGPAQQGPRLSDLRLQSSSYGAMEPIVWGTMRLAGNVIWQTDLSEHSHTSGGKGGGGPKQTTYSYSASFDVLVTGVPLASISKIWAYGRLIYDNFAGLGTNGEVPVTFYLGDSDQLPDPLEEADTGVGLTPAYRDAGRLLLNNWDLTPFSNQIPALEFLVNSNGFETGLIREVSHIDNDPPAGSYIIIGSWTPSPDPDAEPVQPETGDAPTVVYLEAEFGFHSYRYRTMNPLVFGDGASVQLWGVPTDALTNNPTQVPPVSSMMPYISGVDPPQVYGTNFAWLAGVPVGKYIRAATSNAANTACWLFTSDDGGSDVNHWYKIKGASLADCKVVADGTVDPPVSASLIGWGSFLTAPDGPITTGDYGVSQFEPNGRYCWAYYTAIPVDLSPNGGSVFLFYIDADGNFARLLSADYGYPIRTGAGAQGAIFAMADGYCGTIGGSLTSLWTRYESTDAPVSLGYIVGDLCARAGMALGTYDTSQLTDRVRGFGVTAQMSCRAAIEALMPVFFFDAVESDGVLKFVKRGGDPVVEIPDLDLQAHEDGQGMPALLSYDRTPEVELPAEATIVYVNPAAHYQLGTQIAQRMVTESEETRTVQTTVVLTDQEAKQRIDAWLHNAWLERDTFTFQTTRKYAYLEPTDVVTVRSLRLRITAKTEGATGVIKWTALRSYSPVFTQVGVAGTADGFGSPPGTPPTVPVAQGTDLVLLDMPIITDDGNTGVWRPAMAGAERVSWAGASLQRSRDGGANYTEVIADNRPDTIGRASTALHEFLGGYVFDEVNTVTVVLDIGAATLESTSATEVLNGANLAILGGEVIQYKNAVLTDERTYVLSGLLRGLYGTEWAMNNHVAGEPFVALPTVNVLNSASADHGIERLYKAVTSGRALSTAEAVPFRDTGVSLLPYAPVQLGIGSDGGDGFVLTWVRRARVNNNWRNFADVPLDEAQEFYHVTLWSDATYTVPVVVIGVGTTTLNVTASVQTEYFGELQSELFWTVAQLGRIGLGYDSLGRAPVVSMAPEQPTTPPTTPTNPPGGGATFVNGGWFDAFRFENGGSALTNAMKNANFLFDEHGSSWGFAYVLASTRNGTGLSATMQAEFIAQPVGDGLSDANRVINTFSGYRGLAPAGFLVPWGGQIIGTGPNPWTSSPDSPPALRAYAGGLNLGPTIIPLPYPDNTST